MPLFDCLFCCQEHFVLRKMGDSLVSSKFAFSMQQHGFETARKKWLQLDDYESAQNALKELTSSAEVKLAGPKLRLIGLNSLNEVIKSRTRAHQTYAENV